MKHNHHIDYFSSPNPKYIGFSDIRQPYQDINNDNYQDDHQEDKKTIRKLSCNNMYEPIIPFAPEFFNEILEFGIEPQQSQIQPYEQNILMLKTQHVPSLTKLQTTAPIIDSAENNSEIKPDYEDMFSEFQEQEAQMQESSNRCEEIFETPKRKPEFINQRRSFQTTGEKSISRNNEKGLRRLSSLAYSIVNHSPATTYKEVAQKLLTQLNFDMNQLDDEECRAEKSSMQNVKRRVYDSLNVLIALGVIQRVGNKITRQKTKQSFLSGQNPDKEKYNDLLDQYKNRLMNMQAKRKTQRQLKDKIQIFRKIIQRNQKTKNINKNKIIRLPFLIFVEKTEQKRKLSKIAEQKISQKISWINKKPTQNSEKQKKNTNKRNHNNVGSINQRTNDQIVQVNFKSSPESYGDFDIFKLIQEESWFQNQIISQSKDSYIQDPESIDEKVENSIDQFNDIESPIESNHIRMNLIDEVFEHQ